MTYLSGERIEVLPFSYCVGAYLSQVLKELSFITLISLIRIVNFHLHNTSWIFVSEYRL